MCNENAKLLGIEIDCKLTFDLHVSQLCKKASRQINALMRLSNMLDHDVKMNIFMLGLHHTVIMIVQLIQ